MAVGANTYGTEARVEARIGDLVASRNFTTSTTPTTAQVEEALDDIADDLNHNLRASGYTVPIANSDSDVEAYGLLVMANTLGACALLLSSFPTEAIDPDAADALGGNRAAYYQRRYEQVMTLIKDRELAASRGTTRLGRVYTGAQEDAATGLTKSPVFTRDMWDFPGSISRTSS